MLKVLKSQRLKVGIAHLVSVHPSQLETLVQEGMEERAASSSHRSLIKGGD